MLRFDEIDWDDPSFGGEVSRAITRMLGWVPDRYEGLHLVDPARDHRETGYSVWGGSLPWFDPYSELRDAIYAAQILSDRRRILFTIARDPKRAWKAGFRVSGRFEAVGEHKLPERAVCRAVLKLLLEPERRE